ncbi:type II secretion system protein [Bacillus suaedae]|uniref:Type II secretion system protein n=1 Tax=Halalkalibacter suaedae TaxID=2822140 RepID=A0A941AP73_9BACI|nr:type II secretion system protein [Bacillus suaedae]MBP3951506.1 type II secretion system protein [Bacillus suaedae]
MLSKQLNRGITLSELLMSISCIGIVIIVLFPVVSNTVAEMNDSLTNVSIGQIESAISMYELENASLPLGGEVVIRELPENFKDSLMKQVAENSELEGEELEVVIDELLGNVHKINVDQLTNYVSDTSLLNEIVLVDSSSKILSRCMIKVENSRILNIENTKFKNGCYIE